MIEYVSLSMIKAEKDATVLLYTPGADPYFEDIVKNTDNVSTLKKVQEFNWTHDQGHQQGQKPS